MNQTFLPHTRTIDVYSSPSTHYIVGSVGSGLFRVLFVERSDGTEKLSNVVFADPKLYDLPQLTKLLRTPTRRTTHERRVASRGTINAEYYAESEGLRSQNSVPVHQFRAHALLGAIRFLRGYYFVFCTARKRVGYLNGHVVYSVAATRTLSATAPRLGLDSSNETGMEDAGDVMSSWTKWLSRRNLNHPAALVAEMEAQYASLFQLVDLTKGDFFFSYTMDLTNPIQRSLSRRHRVEDEFAWNEYLMQELREVIMLDDGNCANAAAAQDSANKSLWTTDSWILPLLHGSFQQQTCELFGKTLTLTLLARRSRFNAGTRYLKRGINEQGKVANHVEVEQILEIESTSISAFCQVRGSIPTYWSQETSLSVPKPPIKQYRLDPAYKSTRRHFTELLQRFSQPIIVLNLVRQAAETRESFVGQEYANAVDQLKIGLERDDDKAAVAASDVLEYHAIDFKAIFSKKSGGGGADASSAATATAATTTMRGEDILQDLATRAVQETGVFFYSTQHHHRATTSMATTTLQRGTMRTNCIDNLDRTNAGQLFFGLAALREQLKRAGLDAEHFLSGRLCEVFLSMFEELGDRIAQQYGGSQAHKKTSSGGGSGGSSSSGGGGVSNSSSSVGGVSSSGMEGARTAGTAGKKTGAPHATVELLTSIRRYYSNSFTDRAKQDAINLFLGCFVPRKFHPMCEDGRLDETQPQQALWDLETDFYLHNFAVTDEQSLELDMDIGTQAWWDAVRAREELQKDMDAFAHNPVTIHSSLWDEEDSGFYIKFDQVFADDFFCPEQIAPPPPPAEPTRESAAAARPLQSGGEAEESVASSSQPAAQRAASLAEQRGPMSMAELVQAVDSASLHCFEHAVLVAAQPSIVFAPPSVVDPALLEYMDDLTVNAEDMHEVGRVQAKYATTRVLPPGCGEFSGMRREIGVASLYAADKVPDPSKVLPIYSFQLDDVALARANEDQRKLFESIL